MKISYCLVIGTLAFAFVSDVMSAESAYDGSDPVLWDDFKGGSGKFDKRDGRLTGYLQITSKAPGSSIRPAYVRSGNLVAPPMGIGQTKVATYTGVDIAQPPKQVSARITFGPGDPGGAVALISTQAGVRSLKDITGDLNNINSGSVHFVFTDWVTLAQYFDKGKLVTVTEMKYPRIKAQNCPCFVSWAYAGSGIFKVHLPDRRTEIFKSLEMASKLGRFVIFEHYYKRHQTPTSIIWIGVGV
jgi:hypothetical protein